ncbi:MAG: class I SAM-dependent methyltransferase [Magnetococcales bacterium]|nr:class I SAM-dependent methyltransferase [Magnetococcales bacterium]
MPGAENAKQEWLTRVPCPVCGSGESVELRPAAYPADLTREGLEALYSASSDEMLLDALVRCLGCDLVYLNPRVDEEIILAGYTGAEDPTFVAQNPERIETFKRSLGAIARNHGLQPASGVKVLDVGCGGGAFPKAAADLGYEVVGIEPSRWLAEWGREQYQLDIRPGVLAEQNFEPHTFDLITLWDVIEHLTDPGESLERIRGLLKPGGLLVVNFPDDASLARRLMGWKWPFFLSVHLIYFTPKTLTRLLNDRGFEASRVRPYWQTLALGYLLRRAGAYFKVFGWLGRLVDQLGLGRIPLRYNMGQSLLVARKRL